MRSGEEVDFVFAGWGLRQALSTRPDRKFHSLVETPLGYSVALSLSRSLLRMQLQFIVSRSLRWHVQDPSWQKIKFISIPRLLPPHNGFFFFFLKFKKTKNSETVWVLVIRSVRWSTADAEIETAPRSTLPSQGIDHRVFGFEFRLCNH